MTVKKKAKKRVKRKTVRKARKMPAKRKVKKKVAKRKAKKKVARKLGSGPPSGYEKNDGGKVLMPKGRTPKSIVKVSKLKSGLKKAQDEIQEMLDAMTDMTDGYDISEISLSVSFSADGKFLGVGVGGATSIQIKLSPADS